MFCKKQTSQINCDPSVFKRYLQLSYWERLYDLSILLKLQRKSSFPVSEIFIFLSKFRLKRIEGNFSLVACHALKFIRFSLLVVKSLVTRSKICLLLVAEVACSKNSPVTRCRSSSLQKSLAACCTNCSFEKKFFHFLKQSPTGNFLV